MQVTFGIFPLKYPVGVDVNLIKCGSSALNKIKNFLSGMKYKKTQEEHLQEAKIARKEEEQQKGVHVEEEDEAISIEEDLESGGMDEETEEDAEVAARLGGAQGNSRYGGVVVSDTARGSSSCSRLRVFGGFGIDLGAIDIFLTMSRAWIKGLEAAVALGLSLVKDAKKNKASSEGAVAKAWLPTKASLRSTWLSLVLLIRSKMVPCKICSASMRTIHRIIS